ncbi:MAG TPA: cyclopropane-fatty-acyl-phospholipid synthase family protein [Sphingomicrobium sp.]|nr:cyclopropane-fatty-acyl-phospholipid synthase family protein [Sphingomicrobium sp.]
MWLLDLLLRKSIRRGCLIVVDHAGREYRYGKPDANFPTPIRVRLHDRRTAFAIARDPQFGLGEAYMDKRLTVERGDIRELALLASWNAPFGADDWIMPKGPVRRAASEILGRLDRVNRRPRARRNAEYSYNLSRLLYELFLDEDRQYTCAYFRDPANSLEQAQLDKKAHIAAKLHVKPGMTVLDIGCGWGGMALYLHRHYDVDVLGVALAPDQIACARERAAAAGVSDRVKFELMDYRDLTGQFDRIVNVGLIEHLGTPHFPGFFARCRELLAPEGVMVSHCCGRMGAPGVTDKWLRKYIFPGGYIPALSELVAEAERHRLIVSDVETLRSHYAFTLQEWYARTNAAGDEIVRMYDERFLRMWRYYLAGAEAGFRYGAFVNFQVQYLKRRDALPITRDYMAVEEARLRASDRAPEWHLARRRQAAQ